MKKLIYAGAFMIIAATTLIINACNKADDTTTAKPAASLDLNRAEDIGTAYEITENATNASATSSIELNVNRLFVSNNIGYKIEKFDTLYLSSLIQNTYSINDQKQIINEAYKTVFNKYLANILSEKIIGIDVLSIDNSIYEKEKKTAIVVVLSKDKINNKLSGGPVTAPIECNPLAQTLDYKVYAEELTSKVNSSFCGLEDPGCGCVTNEIVTIDLNGFTKRNDPLFHSRIETMLNSDMQKEYDLLLTVLEKERSNKVHLDPTKSYSCSFLTSSNIVGASNEVRDPNSPAESGFHYYHTGKFMFTKGVLIKNLNSTTNICRTY